MGSDRPPENGSEEETSEADAPREEPEKPRAKKKKRRKKRAKKKSASEPTDGKKTDGKKTDDKKTDGKKTTRKKTAGEPAKKADDEHAPKRRIPWLAIILTIAAVELFLFGSRGRIEVCVAKQGVHDLGLLGTPRTDDNTARYPACEKRLNIGMKSDFDELKMDAVVQACRRANIFKGKEAILTCAVEADGWKHQVTTAFVAPWEADYRKRLFWFLD